LRKHRYFQIDLSPAAFDPTPDPDGALTRQKLMEAVDRHLMTERPLGVFLSGGLDSSAVVACMRLLGHRNIHTYTVGFEGFLDNEFATARDVATHFHAEHNEVLITADIFWESLDEVVYSTDEPLGDLTTVPLYHLSKAASRQLVVVLSGEGADELLGGYPGSEKILRMFERHQSLRAVAPLAKAAATLPWPDSIGRKLENIAGSAADYLARTRMNMTEVFTAEDRRTYISSALRAYDPGGALADFYTERQHWDGMNLYFGALIEWWLPDDLLHKADRMTMAHSLELRCPFLDLEFARHCARLTLNHKLRSLDHEPSRKIVLKKAFERLLPPGIAMQRKKGFAIPVYTWLVDRYAARAKRELDREEGLGSSLLTRDSRRSMLEAAQAGDTASQHRVWLIIVLNKWGDRWL
jgi:asparagine synthase (glutamine-hydrolysing)